MIHRRTTLALLPALLVAPLLLALDRIGGAGPCECLTIEQRRILDRMSMVQMRDGKGGVVPTVRFTGVNVQVVSGLGATNGDPSDPSSIDLAPASTNGAGNLIVGYNEPGNLAGDDRTGSHNLVVGSQLSYRSFGGRVFGQQNVVEAPFAGVGGGQFNAARAPFSTVAGGDSNETFGWNAAICGGEHNVAVGFGASVAGGFGNLAFGDFSAVAGGQNNIAASSSSTIAGGSSNTVDGDVGSIAGGRSNTASGDYSAIGGGENRIVLGESDWKAGSLFQDD